METIQIAGLLTGFLFAPLIVFYHEKNELRKLRQRASNIIKQKEELINIEFISVLNIISQGDSFTQEIKEEIMEISYNNILLKYVLESIDDLVDLITRTIIYGISSPIMFFLYIWLIQDTNFFELLGNYMILGFGLVTVLVGYMLGQYISIGIPLLRKSRRTEKKINELDECDTYRKIKKYFE